MDLDRRTRKESNKLQENGSEENTHSIVRRLFSADYAGKVIVMAWKTEGKLNLRRAA